MATEAPPPPSDPTVARASGASALVGTLAGVVAFTGLALSQGEFSADQRGLGLNTVPAVASDAEGRLSGYFNHLPELASRIARERVEGRRVVLWLGASQLYSINHRAVGDEIAVHYANARAKGRGAPLRYVQVASPNANLQELVKVYQALRAEPGRLPHVLVLALTYDDLGERDVRPAAASVTASAPGDPSAPKAKGPSPPRGTPSQAADQAAPVARSATQGTPQERLEAQLVRGLEQAWPGYAKRASVRSRLIVAWKEPLTKLAFQIRGLPGRVVDPATEAWNREALDEFFRLTKADGVQLRIYKPPHQPGLEPFYHPRAAYDAFFEELAGRCARAGVPYLDLETIVPQSEWGLTNNFLPDVFHFRDSGHRLLGAAIDRWLEQRP